MECLECNGTGIVNGWVSPDGDYDFDTCDCRCIDCRENEAIDGFRCFGCGIDYHYSEGIDLFTTQEAK